MKYSAVIPIFNEAQVLREFYRRLKQVMDQLQDCYELIFVNDGSTDKTLDILKQLKSNDNKIVIINFGQNLGQAQALQIGFERAQGTIVISLDADLQNDPADIPLLLEQLTQGYDLVCGNRRSRQDRWAKRVVSHLGNFSQRLILGVPIHDMACALRVYRRPCLRELKLDQKGLQAFIPFIIWKKGYKISEVVTHHHRRSAGSSKYGLVRQISEIATAFLYLRHNFR